MDLVTRKTSMLFEGRERVEAEENKDEWDSFIEEEKKLKQPKCTNNVENMMGAKTFFMCSCSEKKCYCWKCCLRLHKNREGHSVSKMERYDEENFEESGNQLCCPCGVKKEDIKFFLCLCSKKNFEPICEHCIENCHKGHDYFFIPEFYDCECGKKDHVVEEYIADKEECFLNKFAHYYGENRNTFYQTKKEEKSEEDDESEKEIENEGNADPVEKSESVLICWLKYQLLEKEEKSKYEAVVKEEGTKCQCKLKFSALKVASLFSPNIYHNIYKGIKGISTHIKNFNMNFFQNTPELKEHTIDYINDRVEEFKTKRITPSEIFEDYKFYNAVLSVHYSYFYIKNPNTNFDYRKFLNETDINIYMDILRDNHPPPKLSFYFLAKFSFAEYIFINFVESNFTRYNLCKLSIENVVNMNLYQRYIYLANAKNFFLLNESRPEIIQEIMKSQQHARNISDALLDFGDQMLNTLKLKDNISENSFLIFARTFKWLAKRGLEFDLDRFITILAGLEENFVFGFSHFNPVFQIIKCLFYILLLENDKRLIDSFRNPSKKVVYVFEQNENCNRSYNLAVELLRRFIYYYVDYNDSTEAEKHKFSFCLKKGLDLLLGKSEFMKPNILNLKELPDYQIELLKNKTLSYNSEDVIKHLNDQLNKNTYYASFHDKMNNFSQSLRKNNNQYFNNEITIENFFNSLNVILGDIRKHFNDQFESIPPLNKKYLPVTIADLGNKVNQTKIKEMQEAIKFTNFFQSLDGVFQIIAENLHRESERTELKENMTALLYFLFMLIKEDYQTILLLCSSLNPKNFVLSFEDCEPYFYLFLEGLMDALFGLLPESEHSPGVYQFDNHYFYTKIIEEIVDLMDFKEEDCNKTYLKNLKRLQHTFKLCRKPLKFFKFTDPSAYTLILKLTRKIEKIRKNERLQNDIKNYFATSKDDKKEEKDKMRSLEKIIKNYYMFINECRGTEFFYLGGGYSDPHDNFLIKNELFIDTANLPDNFLNNVPLVITFEIQTYRNNAWFKDKTPFYMTRLNCVPSLLWRFDNRKIQEIKKSQILKKSQFDQKNIDNVDLENQTLSDFMLLRDSNSKVANICGYLNHEKENPEMDFLNTLNKKSQALIASMTEFLVYHFEYSYEIKPIIRRKLALYKFFERAIVKPVYYILNLYLNYGDQLEGPHLHQIYMLVMTFLDASRTFYYQIREKLIVKDDIVDINEYENSKLNRLETFVLRTFRNTEKMAKLTALIEDYLTEINEMQYTDTERVFEIFHDVINRIIKKKEKSGTKEPGLKKKTKNYGNNCISEIKELKSKYFKSVKKCTGNDRSLSYSIAFGRINDADPNVEFFYILSGVNNDENITSWEEFYRMRPEFFFLYTIMNEWSSHDCQKFQGAIFYFSSNYYSDLIDIIKRFYFYFVAAEVKKTYELESRVSENVTFKLTTNLLKFIQNCCEGHNTKFQNYFYGMQIYNYRLTYRLADGEHKIAFPKYDSYFEPSYHEDISEKEKSIKNFEIRGVNLKNLFHIKNMEELLKLSEKEFNYVMKMFENLYESKFLFINFLFLNLKFLISNSNYPNTDANLLFKNRTIKSNINLEKISGKIIDLIIEMVQGCEQNKLHCFSFDMNFCTQMNLHENIQGTNIVYNLEEEFFYFSKFLSEMSLLFKTESLITQSETIPIKRKMFTLINTLMNQVENEEKTYIADSVTYHFSVNFMLSTITSCLKHVYNMCVKQSENKMDLNFNLTKEISKELFETYKKSKEMFENPYFQLAAEIFLTITIIAKKFKFPEALKLFELNMEDEEDSDNLPTNDEIVDSPIDKTKVLPDAYQLLPNENIDQTFSKEKINLIEKSSTVYFFSQIVRQCEFLIKEKKSTSELNVYDSYCGNIELLKRKEFENNQKQINFRGTEETSNPKVIYFVVDPKCYDISLTKKKQFFDNVDRSTTNSKLKEFLEEITLFYLEVNYKSKKVKAESKEGRKEKGQEIDNFDKMDVRNFQFSLLANLILLFFVSNSNISGNLYYYLILCLFLVQIWLNLNYLYGYFKVRFNYSVLIEKERLGLRDKENLSHKEKFEVYVLRSALSEEIYLFYFNIIICLSCIISPKAFVLIPLQLFNAMKFVPTIKQVIQAFQMKFNQFAAMISFLGILLYFYANIGFYFIPSQFEMQFDDGTTGNACTSLISCFLLYFNFGVRSGGGIGDVTGQRAYDGSFWFWFKWISDMIFYITVILLIMNMINGIIISTFSQIREEYENKVRDKEDVCFICSRERSDFEKKKHPFGHHVTHEHNPNNYIYFLITLLLTKKSNMNSDQSYIYECFSNKDIAFFPVEKTIYLQNEEKEDEDDNQD